MLIEWNTVFVIVEINNNYLVYVEFEIDKNMFFVNLKNLREYVFRCNYEYDQTCCDWQT